MAAQFCAHSSSITQGPSGKKKKRRSIAFLAAARTIYHAHGLIFFIAFYDTLT